MQIRGLRRCRRPRRSRFCGAPLTRCAAPGTRGRNGGLRVGWQKNRREPAMTAAAAKHDAPDLMSRHVKPDEMPWQQLQFPGCEIKPLYFDAKTGQATLLFKMAPGATLPDHEHALLEQTYVLEGSLVDKDGPEAGLEVK